MNSAIPDVRFVDPAAAAATLAALEGRLPAALVHALPALLPQLPDPDGSLNALLRFLEGAAPATLSFMEHQPAAFHYAMLVFSYTRYLSELLVQQPDLIRWLYRRVPGEGLPRHNSTEDLLEEFARFAASQFDQPVASILARFKRREYLRIMLQDVLGLVTLGETTLELSHLADVLLDRALRFCEQPLENQFGAPQYRDAAGRIQPARLTIVSLGKLGGRELNYSSDIDLMFLYSRDGETAGGSRGTISNSEYFIRLAQAILRRISESTPEGAVFRVDTRLRPEGNLGELALGLPAALDYYRSRAREWELQMLIKARVSAGDAATGRAFLREVHPLIFRRELNVAAVEAVLQAREEISRGLARGGAPSGDYSAAWNVKLTPGGIRDIEFLVQCLQRVHGGRDPWLAAAGVGSTLVALGRLQDKGYLSSRDFSELSSAYEFLRRVEHRLQIYDGLQRHTLPESPASLHLLARRCGIEASAGQGPAEILKARIAHHFAAVRAIYDRLVTREPAPAAAFEDAFARPDSGFGSFHRRLESDFPNLARILHTFSVDERDLAAAAGLERFLSAALLVPGLAAELDSHTKWLRRAGGLFSRSDLALEMLSRRPEDARLLGSSEARAELQPAAGISSLPLDVPADQGLAALRVALRRAHFRILVESLEGLRKPFDTFAALAAVADQTLRHALAFSWLECFGAASPLERLDASPFAVIALGRLGSAEFDFGSDADLFFVVDEATGPDALAQFRRLAERFVQAVSSHTREGILFPVDTRLRPRGREGEIVQSSAYLRDYFCKDAEGWEAAAFLKARGVAGNLALAARVIAENQAALRERFAEPAHGGLRDGGPADLALQLLRTRDRLEREAPRGGLLHDPAMTTAAGGFYDLDYILSFRALAKGVSASSPGTVVQIAALESAAALSASEAATFRDAAIFYRSLDHARRISSGLGSGAGLEPAQLPRLTALLKLWGLLDDRDIFPRIESTRLALRNFYRQIVTAK